MRFFRLVGLTTLTGLIAGLVWGLVDGLRAGVAGRLDGDGLLKAALLAASVDGLVGGGLGVVVGMLGGLRRWARTRQAPTPARVVGWILAGVCAAVPTVLAVFATAGRVNRFLAAAVVVLALFLGVLVALVLQPAIARVLAFGRSRVPQGVGRPRLLDGASVLFAPLAFVAIQTVVFLVVWRTRAPLRGSVLWERAAWVATLAALAPWVFAWVAARGRVLWPGLGTRVAGATAVLVFVGGLAILVALRWEVDLQYLPWRDLIGALMIALMAGFFYRVVGPRMRRMPALVLLGLVLLSLGAVISGILFAAESEAARKAATTRAGLVGPVLALVRSPLDFDGDGYPGLLGGGDCDDRDPAINPAALDWPGDGVDQDCDGRDADTAVLQGLPFHARPDGVPGDMNVLLIAIDTLRADHLGCYGYTRATSPVLDTLAREAVLFENGWAHAPSTRYSMPALVTGRWPSTIDWNNSIWWPGLGEGVHTLAQSMKALDYWNGAYWAYNYFDPRARRGFERAVDVYDAKRALLHQNVDGPSESLGSSARQIADDGMAFVAAHQDRKWFLTLHFYDPHLSYEKHPEVTDFGDAPVDRYDNEILFTDQQIGRVFDRLRALGLWDRTMVVVTGDHGEGFGERGISAHGYHLYPPQTKVPFIVRVPGIAPRRVTVPVGHVDLAPTIVNLAGGDRPPAFLGGSLVDLMTGNARPGDQVVFQEVSYEGNNKKRALVNRTHQLIWNWTPHNTTECYDLTSGGLEGADLWGTSAGEPVCSDLKRRLRSMVAALSLPVDYHDRIAAAVIPPGGPAPVPGHPLSEDTRVTFGEAVQIVGFDLPSLTVDRGQSLELGVHFRVLARPPADYKMFVHLEGPGGFDNLDHVPVHGAYPLERWQPGQTIIDRHSFVIPTQRPAGRYQILIGFWRGSDRLSVAPASLTDGQRRHRLLELQVR